MMTGEVLAVSYFLGVAVTHPSKLTDILLRLVSVQDFTDIRYYFFIEVVEYTRETNDVERCCHSRRVPI